MAGRGSNKSKGRPVPRNLYSFSRIKAFFQCPARYRYRYLKGQSEAFKSIEAHLGSTVHDVLEWLYDARDKGSTPRAANVHAELDHRWRAGWNDSIAIVRVADRAELYLAMGHEMIERYCRSTLAKDQSTTVALETRLSRKLASGHTFTGFADRIGRTTSGRLFVVDYKTSRSLGTSEELSEGLQAPLYAACAIQRWDEAECLAGYHYLRHGETRWSSVSRAQGEHLLSRFDELVGEVVKAERFPAKPSVLCAWCGFNHQCPEAKVPPDLGGGQSLARRLEASD